MRNFLLISGATEEERRQKIRNLFRDYQLLNEPEKVVYITLNRRKLKDLADYWAAELGDAFFLPQLRTLRGYYDSIHMVDYPEYIPILQVEKQLIWRNLIVDSEKREDSRLLHSLLEDMLEFDHWCSLYCIPYPDRLDLLEHQFPTLREGYEWLHQQWENILHDRHAMDYDEMMVTHPLHEDPTESDTRKWLILDGLYWLYPYQKVMLEQFMPRFTDIVWIENECITTTEWRDPAKRNLPDFLLEKISPILPEKSFAGSLLGKINTSIQTGDEFLTVIPLPTQNAEVEATGYEILRLMDEKGVSPDEITVIYHDLSYLPLIEHFFTYAHIPYDPGRGRRLKEVPLYALWFKLLQLPLSNFPVEDTLDVMSALDDRFYEKVAGFSPLSYMEMKTLKEWLEFGEIRHFTPSVLAFQVQPWFGSLNAEPVAEEFFPQGWVDENSEKIKEEIPVRLFSALDKIRKFISRFPAGRQIHAEEWIGWLKESFEWITSLAPGRSWTIDERVTGEGEILIRELKSISRFYQNTCLSYEQWFSDTLFLAHKKEIQDPSGRGVRILEKLEARDLIGEYLFVLGNCKQFFPAPPRYAPLTRLMMDAVKQKPDRYEIFSPMEEARYLWWNQNANFRKIYYTVPSQVNDEKAGLSPILILEIAEVLKPVLDFSHSVIEQIQEFIRNRSKPFLEWYRDVVPFSIMARPEEGSPKPIPVSDSLFSVRTGKEPLKVSSIYDGFLAPDESWNRFLRNHFPVAEEISWSPTRVDVLALCPQKYWYRYWLKIREQQISEDGLDFRLMGQFFHLMLKRAFRDPEIIPALNFQSDHSVLHRVVSRHFEQTWTEFRRIFSDLNPYFGLMIDGVRQKLQKQKFLENLTMEEYRRLNSYSEQVEKIQTEVKMEGKIDLPEGRKITISGRIDRLDQMKTAIYFYDYKYSTKDSGSYLKSIRKGLYWQLLLYYFLLKKLPPEGMNIPRSILGFVYPIKISSGRRITLQEKNFRDFFSRLPEEETFYTAVLAKLITIFDQYHFYCGIGTPADIGCDYCDYQKICNRKKPIRKYSGSLDEAFQQCSWAEGDCGESSPVKFYPFDEKENVND